MRGPPAFNVITHFRRPESSKCEGRGRSGDPVEPRGRCVEGLDSIQLRAPARSSRQNTSIPYGRVVKRPRAIQDRPTNVGCIGIIQQ